MDISQILLFKYLSPKEIVKLSEHLTKNTVPKGTEIFKEGDEGEKMYIILSGKVQVSILDKSSKLVLATLKEGTFFGEMSLLSSIKRSATIRAEEESIFYTISRENLKDIMKNHPSIAVKILYVIASELSNRISKTDKILADYFERNKEIVNNQLFKELYIYTLGGSGNEESFL